MNSDEHIWLLGVLPETSLACKVTLFNLQKVLIEGLGVSSSQLRIFIEPVVTALSLDTRREAELAELNQYLNSTGFLKLSSHVRLTQLVENRDMTTNIKLIKAALFLHRIGKLT
jgi:hypothetical protein